MYEESELFYTSAILEPEARELGEYIFGGQSTEIGDNMSIHVDKVGVRSSVWSAGARQWVLTYDFKVVVYKSAENGGGVANGLSDLAAAIEEDVFEEESREIKRIAIMHLCAKKFDDCTRMSEG